MKMSIIKITRMIPVMRLVLVIAAVAGVSNACSKSHATVDRTCTIAFILNETNAAGDTTFVTAMAGTLVQNAPVPVRAGYTFNGWYANSADANPNPTKNTAPPTFPAYDITVKPIYLDVILYARWVK